MIILFKQRARLRSFCHWSVYVLICKIPRTHSNIVLEHRKMKLSIKIKKFFKINKQVAWKELFEHFFLIDLESSIKLIKR